ncbi:ATP-dependent helicase [Planctomycetota bacterium]
MIAGLEQILSSLNPQQRAAVDHGEEPLLIIAGAGTGKTTTLAHRVAALIAQGVNPARILLLTFTRRAAQSMQRRVDGILRQIGGSGWGSSHGAAGSQVWGGTFHAVALKLLQMHGRAVGVEPQFTVHDQGDSEDLMNLVRTELGLDRTGKRFPKKETCLAVYSHSINTNKSVEEIIERQFPWCRDYVEALDRLFLAYINKKVQQSILDYDDLLLYWFGLVQHEAAGQVVRQQFDAVLVDEYQDTNALQAEILRGLCPDGRGLTVVGDDAQAIYSFRGATVRNILDFPNLFPGATIIKLEENYRSTQPILEVANRVIAQASEQHNKSLWSRRNSGEAPRLVTCEDEYDQAEFIIRQVLGHREEGITLQKQAVLFRASFHAMSLEMALMQRNIPFRKFGGRKFVEKAHVKDVVAFLRLAENPGDMVAGMRLLMLLPGIGPRTAKRMMDELGTAGGNFNAWVRCKVPAAAEAQWASLVQLLTGLAGATNEPLDSQLYRIRTFYQPILEDKEDNPETRLRDLEQLEQLAGRFPNRATFVTQMALDPPESTQGFARAAPKDEEYLVLSTMHSAKGLEFDAVYVIHAVDGRIPSEKSCGSVEEIDEERRLFYMALTRAKDWLYVCFPQRHYSRGPVSNGKHSYAQLSRFLTREVTQSMHRHSGTVGAIHTGGADRLGIHS